MAVPRFLPTWLGGDADRVDGPGARLAPPGDAAPEWADGLPPDLVAILNDPRIVIPRDREVHDLLARTIAVDGTVPARAYLNLYALLQLSDQPSEGAI